MAEAVLRSKIEKFVVQFAPVGTPVYVKLLGPARLFGWRFSLDLFSAGLAHRVADIIPAGDGSEVWGALYELPVELVKRSDGGRSVLDRIEGHRTSSDPENYEPMRLTVDVAGRPSDAWTYVGREDARARCLRDHSDARVSATYCKAIIDGASALVVPPAYLEELKATLAANR
jgi:hypothetical protein